MKRDYISITGAVCNFYGYEARIEKQLLQFLLLFLLLTRQGYKNMINILCGRLPDRNFYNFVPVIILIINHYSYHLTVER